MSTRDIIKPNDNDSDNNFEDFFEKKTSAIPNKKTLTPKSSKTPGQPKRLGFSLDAFSKLKNINKTPSKLPAAFSEDIESQPVNEEQNKVGNTPNKKRKYDVNYDTEEKQTPAEAKVHSTIPNIINNATSQKPRHNNSSGLKKKKYKQYYDDFKPGMIRFDTKWVYPNEEVKEEYSFWEHKKRAQEMHETKDKALQLTETSSGPRHMGGYLPKEELEKFNKKVQAVKSGKQIDLKDEDYEKHKISSSNKGFQMLMKQGWKEGKGLGSKEQGITAPVNKKVNEAGPSNSGLGTEKTHEVQEGDDEFEIYRKRMMLAYKFRPNPLNNPRREYY
ncbi:SURP and G-patch domain-containing protein 1 [Mycoemilia scoparia]|uniref:SURP and G-patch domain-containing protein 1 n=1 Tax=Mycoemilia scoparia TaxID=417184 RepID=A0A9W8DUF7_9FUNG|nr:SURP and G-patch domain-containing protein 1 [Mycoemilia scoparia]